MSVFDICSFTDSARKKDVSSEQILTSTDNICASQENCLSVVKPVSQETCATQLNNFPTSGKFKGGVWGSR